MTLSSTVLFRDGSLEASEVRCSCPAGRRDEELTPAFEAVFSLAGAFERRAGEGRSLVDAAFGYVTRPGVAHEITHVTDGDRCLVVSPDAVLADELGLDHRPAWVVPVDRALQRLLAHALSGSTSGDALVAGEAWLDVLARLGPPPTPPGTRGAAAQRTAAVARVREAIAVDPGARWETRTLGAVAGYAPQHLSRVFRATTGMTLGGYRDRIRLGRAVALVRDGMALADVAAALGFVDQAHLSRRAAQVLGAPPSAFRSPDRARMSKPPP